MNVTPNIILILAISFVLKGNFLDGFLLAGIGGLCLDLGSSLFFGIYASLFLITITIINFLILRITESQNLFFIFIIFAVSVIFVDLILLLVISHWPTLQILTGAMINGLWGVIIYWLLGKILPTMEEIKIV